MVKGAKGQRRSSSKKARSKPKAGSAPVKDHRIIRDPIHGDIPLRPLQAAVVNTRIFQRLRYIRQNGLLHFVFPGAVHTRFAHSIGTMALASQVGRRLLGPFKLSSKKERSASRYVEMVFTLAALLHDIGHCAFSHAIEKVKYKGKPFFGTLRQRFESWNEDELLKEYVAAFPDRADEAIDHEQLGLAFVRRIFLDPSVVATCSASLSADAKVVGRDVRAIMNGALEASPTFKKHVEALLPVFEAQAARYGDLKLKSPVADLLELLHDLVSGTLDVDRLDYLRRDSYYCGVPYGICDTSVLINNLSLGVVAGRLQLLLRDKAACALDDMLWSRYQLFVQVLNHKTNVGLNMALGHAIPDAVSDAQLDQPDSVDDFIRFTDDHVMSAVIDACLRGDLGDRSYAKALVDRQLPLHLGSERYVKSKLKKWTEARAQEAGVSLDKISTAEAKSEFIKAGHLPLLVGRKRQTGEVVLLDWEEAESIRVPMKHHRVHFFADRG